MEETIAQSSRDLISRGCLGSFTCGIYEGDDGKKHIVIHAESYNCSSGDFVKDWRKFYERCLQSWRDIQAERKNQA